MIPDSIDRVGIAMFAKLVIFWTLFSYTLYRFAYLLLQFPSLQSRDKVLLSMSYFYALVFFLMNLTFRQKISSSITKMIMLEGLPAIFVFTTMFFYMMASGGESQLELESEAAKGNM